MTSCHVHAALRTPFGRFDGGLARLPRLGPAVIGDVGVGVGVGVGVRQGPALVPGNEEAR